MFGINYWHILKFLELVSVVTALSILHILSNSFINGSTIADSLVTSTFSKFPKNADLVQFVLPDIKMLLSIITNLWCIKTSNCFDFGLMPANKAMMSITKLLHSIFNTRLCFLNYLHIYVLKRLPQTFFIKIHYLACIILCHGFIQYHSYNNISFFGFYNRLC